MAEKTTVELEAKVLACSGMQSFEQNPYAQIDVRLPAGPEGVLMKFSVTPDVKLVEALMGAVDTVVTLTAQVYSRQGKAALRVVSFE